VTAELNGVPFEAFADSLQNILKDPKKFIQVCRDYFE
jgi:hypothetical protein